MSNPNCKAGCGLICRCGEIGFGDSIALENLKQTNSELLKALNLIASEQREDAAAWMRGVARAAIAKATGTD